MDNSAFLILALSKEQNVEIFEYFYFKWGFRLAYYVKRCRSFQMLEGL